MTYKNLPPDHQAYFDFSHFSLDQKGYWAGLLDGEGCLRMDICSGQPLPSINLKMTCPKTVQKFADTFEVTFTKRSRASMKEHHKDCYGAHVTTHKAAKICEAFLPYFITKQEIAKKMSEHYIRECEICGDNFWCFNAIKTCSKECQHTRKKQLHNEYLRNRYHEDKKRDLV